MHENNKDRNPHNENTATRRAEIVLRFDVPKKEASQNFIDVIVGVIQREIAVDLGKSAEVEGKWL